MNKTKIEWVRGLNGELGYTWNPVTGCLHGCTYCYAERIAKRFGAHWQSSAITRYQKEPYKENGVYNPYPFDFMPTFHHYRLQEPTKKTKSQNIFVCSMADLFGYWVPDSWIQDVFEACEAAPQHRYLFLTKNPKRYNDLQFKLPLPTSDRYWYGITMESMEAYYKRARETKVMLGYKMFLSIEPVQTEIEFSPATLGLIKWVIVGAQTGPGAKAPDPEWVQSIINQCRSAGVPIFLKNNLNWPVRIQEYPWEKGSE